MPKAARLKFILAAIITLMGPGLASASNTRIYLDAGKLPGSYHLQGGFEVDASSAVAWIVITDYDRIGRFVSSIRSSRVLNKENGNAIIEQEGTGRFLFFSRDVELILAVKEKMPDGRVEFRDIHGSQFKIYEGSWTIKGSTTACSVAYELTALPDPSIGPKFAAKRTLRKNVQRLLEEVRSEIERRAKQLD